jgi:hypothetical protein
MRFMLAATLLACARLLLVLSGVVAILAGAIIFRVGRRAELWVLEPHPGHRYRHVRRGGWPLLRIAAGRQA